VNPTPNSLLKSLRSLPGSVWVLYAGTFINRLGTFVIPFLALYLVDRGFTAAEAGFAISSYGVGHLFASIIGGHLADTLGRRKTILASMAGSAATMLALSQAASYPALLVLSCLAGLTTEVYRPASSALLTDLVDPTERVTAFAGYRIAINAGFGIGPAIGGWMAEHNFTWLFVGDALTSLVFGVITYLALPAGLRLSEAQKVGWRDSLRVIAGDRRFLRLLSASFLVGMIFMQMSTTLGLEVERQGHPKTVFGWVLSWNGLLIVLCELPLTVWTRRFPTLWMMALGYLLCGVGFGMNALGGTTASFLLAMTVFTFGEMISLPLGAAYVAGLAPTELRGRYMGANGLTWALALIVGPSAGTALFAWKPDALWVASAACGVVAACILADGARRGSGTG
jgi:MFS family permease